MRRILSLALLILLNLQISAKEKVLVNSQPGWLYPVKPDLTKVPATRSISNGYYYVLIDEETSLMTGTDYTHYIKEIVNESGIQHESEVSVSFSPEFQQLSFHSIAIIREGKTINQLSPGAIKVVQEETDAADFQYNGIKRAFVTLKDVRKGDRIEVAYSITGTNPIFAKKYSDLFYFANETAVCNYFRTIITTPGRKLIIRNSHEAPAPIEEQKGDQYIYHWNNPPLHTWESVSGAPSWYNAYPTIEVTEFKSWEEVVTWGLDVFSNYRFPLPQSLKTRIEAWKKTASGDQDLFANIATHFVQDEVRYLGLEIGPNTHQPHPPADVYNHRFGDCKDKALLLASILHEDGIPAYVALINTSLRDQLSTATPSTGAFDHAIVAIGRSANEFLYIDPTISSQRGELINRYVPAYGYSLVLKPGESQLRRVDPPFLYNYDIIETLDVKNYDSSKFTVSTTYAGGAADRIRGSFAVSSVKEIEDDYRSYYAKVYSDIQLNGPILTSDDSSKNEFTVQESYSIPQIWSNNETKGRRSMDFAARILNEYLPSPPTTPRGEAPLALSFPRVINYTARITMPEDWGFDMGELHIKNDSYQFDFIPSVSYNHITLKYYFKTFKDHIPFKEIEQYKSDYKNIDDRLSFELYQSDGPSEPKPVDNTPASRPSVGIVFWPAVWLTLIFTVCAVLAFRNLNGRAAFHNDHYAYYGAQPLGGWTIVLGIGLGIGLLWQIVILGMSGYYAASTWAALSGKPEMLRYLFYTALTADLLFLAANAAVFYWYCNRRDIFPSMFTWYAGILLGGQLVLVTFPRFLPPNTITSAYMDEQMKQFFRYAVYAAIWVTYIQRSSRVRATFVRPPY